jgi:hypothetical protein
MSEQSSLHEKIIKNYNTIVQNMKKYINDNTIGKTAITRGTLNF